MSRYAFVCLIAGTFLDGRVAVTDGTAAERRKS